MKDIVARLWQDAQVKDLYRLYWDHSGPAPSVRGDVQQMEGAFLQYPLDPQMNLDARERLSLEIKNINGVRSVNLSGDQLSAVVDPDRRDASDAEIRSKLKL